MLSSYYLPAADDVCVYEWELKRSTFITHIARAMDSEQARDFIHEIKSQYPDATHNCSAYIHHVEGAQPVERSSDDGEPSGTAGAPMLDQLKGSGMLDVVAVVTRYFGGVKLGAGGLVSAYSNSVGDALPLVKRVQRAQRQLFRVDFEHAEAGRMEAELRNHDIAIHGVEYGEKAHYTVAIEPGSGEELDALVASLSRGQAQTRQAGTAWIESTLN